MAIDRMTPDPSALTVSVERKRGIFQKRFTRSASMFFLVSRGEIIFTQLLRLPKKNRHPVIYFSKSGSLAGKFWEIGNDETRAGQNVRRPKV